MNFRLSTLAVYTFTVSVAYAQQSQVFHLTNTAANPNFQEVVTTLRTVADIREISGDFPSTTITVSGTADQLAFAAWLIPNLDRSIGGQTSMTFRVPGAADELALISCLAHSSSPRSLQEILTTLRTVLDVQKIYQNSEQQALILRGDTDRVAATEWLIRELDRTPQDALPSGSHQTQVQSGKDDVLRVFYLPPTGKSPQEVVTALRIALRIQKVYLDTALSAVIVRGDSGRISRVQQYLEELTLERN